jgi:hypothetical protein
MFCMLWFGQDKNVSNFRTFIGVQSIPKNDSVWSGGHKEMSSILADQSALVYEGGGGSCGVSANEYSCTQEPK